MNFDIGSFLQDEIKKQKAEIDSKRSQHGDEVVVAGTEKSQQPAIIEEDALEKSEELNVITEEKGVVVTKESIERLETRPQRIQDIILKESEEINVAISISEIFDESIVALANLALKCNLYIHQILSEWSESLYEPELLLETKKNIFPLLVNLRKYKDNTKIDRNMLLSISTILYHLQQPNEINQSFQSYMKLSIGNVAWPIGVTQIGIHQRSAHSKLNDTKNIANIMIDERTRLWITSLKRLISFKEWLSKMQ